MTGRSDLLSASLDRGRKADKTFAQRMFEWAEPEVATGLAATDVSARPGMGPDDRGVAELEAVLRALTGAARTLADDHELAVRFAGIRPELTGGAIRLPHPGSPVSEAAWRVLRGQADSLALDRRYSGALPLPAGLPPAAAQAFRVIRRARAEALGARDLPGIVGNLDAALAHRLGQLGIDRVTLANMVPGEEAATGLLRRLLGLPVAALTEAQTQPWARVLDQDCPGDTAALAAALDDPPAFAAIARRLALAMAGWFAGTQSAPLPESPDTADGERDAARATESRGADDTAGAYEVSRDRSTTTRRPPDRPYRVFAERYDQAVAATDLASDAELAAWHETLLDEAGDVARIAARLANRLVRLILARQRRSWRFDLEDGLLDAARLDRVVVNPGTALSFKEETDSPFPDTVVGLLIDNSGSMRGQSIVNAAVSAEIIALALERTGVAVEVLGFTTAAWRGGRPAADWARAGRPADPGRLNELRHIVYKPADRPFRHVRSHLGLMLQPDLLKENVDGEALRWAAGRLLRRPQSRRILVVISDGAPQDQATARANDPGYLDRHLRQVIVEIGHLPGLELAAIGIGHDVSRYYPRSITIDDAGTLAQTLIETLGGLLLSADDPTLARTAKGHPR
ncbi:MAG: cobaltochelatase subunit CobT [Azospirillaceae bacterium]